MKKILILISVLISFSVLSDTNSKDNAKLKDRSKPKSNIESKNNADLKEKAKSKGDIEAKNNDSIKYSKIITVHGMVCAFCSNSLEKKLKREEAIDQLKVDLKNKKISVRFKKGKSVEDKKLKEIITSAGFKVIKIKSLPDNG